MTPTSSREPEGRTAYPIAGGDFDHGGSASRRLKEQLKAIGAAADAIRRAMIAAYEAEMNVVIHARHGRLEARLAPDRLDVEVIDEGPGIPDIGQAMKEGFSTAPASARALGFGAGMGLPNIRRNSDVFAIESCVDRGTRIRFTIYLKAQEAASGGRHSIRLDPARCKACLACLRACPTRALRVRGTPALGRASGSENAQPGAAVPHTNAARPEILEHLCIDCTACVAACPTGALATAGGAGALPPADDAVLVLPSAFLYQFGRNTGPARVLAALAQLGFRDVRTTGPWEAALQAAVLEYARAHPLQAPTISPTCPAIVNLIEMRFPSLLGQLAPFLSPMEAMREDLASLPAGAGRRVIFVAECPCQRTAIESGDAKPEIVSPAVLRAAVAPIIANALSEPDAEASGHIRESATDARAGEVLRVTGLAHVLKALEEVENGLMGDVAVLEPLACDEGCWGSPLLAEDPFVAVHRRRLAPETATEPARAILRRTPYAPRAGLRLDYDMAKAIEKLARLQRLVRTLPGIDCGLCGSPTCAALAEDIVLGRADPAACIHRSANEGKP